MTSLKNLETRINKFISFKTESALSSKSLPTATTVLNWLQETVEKAVTDPPLYCNVNPAVLAMLKVSVDSKEQTLKLEGYNVSDGEVAVAQYHYQVKMIQGVEAIRNVLLDGTKNGETTLEEIVVDQIRKNQNADIFKLWEDSPIDFREKHPICPSCGGFIYASTEDDYICEYRLYCQNCGWSSRKTMSDVGEIIGEYVREWYKSERRRCIKEAAAKKKAEQAKEQLKLAVEAMKEANFTVEEIKRMIM